MSNRVRCDAALDSFTDTLDDKTPLSSVAIQKAQTAFTGAAEDIGVSCEEDVQALVDAVHHGAII